MKFLSPGDQRQIAEAIRKAEASTQGEIVTVIARQSDDYFFIPLLWATLLALAVPGLLEILQNPWALSHSYLIQFTTFLVLAILFRWQPLTMRTIPKTIKRQRAHRLAMEQFFQQNLHHTKDRAGLLLFVSVAERYVEIIADKGINDKVEQDQWSRVVARFIGQVKDDQICQGFLQAIETCGEILTEHFPVEPGNKNELPDHLVML
jgi:putative membrane protein